MTSTIVQKNSKHSKSSKNRTIKKQSVITLPFDHLQISRLHNVPSVFVILFTLQFFWDHPNQNPTTIRSRPRRPLFYLINSRYNIYDRFTTITCFPKIFSISGRRGHDRMVVGFTTTCAISAYHH
jgi:hypothetical protein